LPHEKIRNAIFNLIKIVFNRHFLKLYFTIIIYLIIIVLALYKIGFWDISLLKDTIIWVVFSGLVLCFKMIDEKNRKQLFIESLKSTLTLVVIIQFVTSEYTFPLIAEIISVPILVFVGAMIAIAESKEEHRQVSNFLNGIIIIYGLIAIAYSIYQIVRNYEHFFALSTLQTFLLPLILFIMFMPFVYFFALYVLYFDIFIRAQIRLRENKSLLRYMKFNMLLIFNIRLFELEKFYNSFSEVFYGKIETKADIREIFKRHKAKQHLQEK